MHEGQYAGVLFIGDPHICAWPPGYRKDEYAEVTLEKLGWALDYAQCAHLLPVLLGDLFHVPRDNPNWLLGRLMALLTGEILSIVGNHDMSEDQPSPNDSHNVLLLAGRLHALADNPWIGLINGVKVAIGGTNNGRFIPDRVDRVELGNPRWVFWTTHHNLHFPVLKRAAAWTAAKPLEST